MMLSLFNKMDMTCSINLILFLVDLMMAGSRLREVSLKVVFIILVQWHNLDVTMGLMMKLGG